MLLPWLAVDTHRLDQYSLDALDRWLASMPERDRAILGQRMNMAVVYQPALDVTTTGSATDRHAIRAPHRDRASRERRATPSGVSVKAAGKPYSAPPGHRPPRGSYRTGPSLHKNAARSGAAFSRRSGVLHLRKNPLVLHAHFEGVLHANALTLLHGTNPAGIANKINCLVQEAEAALGQFSAGGIHWGTPNPGLLPDDRRSWPPWPGTPLPG